MLELFRVEAETQASVLTSGLLEVERGAATPESFNTLMRAAHSLKGAARIVNLQAAVRVAHALEDCFVMARQGKLHLRQLDIDLLLRGVDLLSQISKHTEDNIGLWETRRRTEIAKFLAALARLVAPRDVTDVSAVPARPERARPRVQAAPPVMEAGDQAKAAELPAVPPPGAGTATGPGNPPGPVKAPQGSPAVEPPSRMVRTPEAVERVLRLNADSLNRLLGLAGESLVESRWLRPFADSLHRLKRQHSESGQELDLLRQVLEQERLSERARGHLNSLSHALSESQQFLAERLQELEVYDRRSAQLSQRLYLEVLRTRMRPFSEGARRFPRMVRDLARSLEKQVRLEILGENTQVDRDILERLETPLAHLLRNAVDHGCEAPEERRRLGKPAECRLQIEARHSAGVLLVTVTDDGAGIDLDRLRGAIVRKGLTTRSVAEKMTEPHLLEFLFRPGFTLKDTVTEISGRGFGLDVVQSMVKSVRGALRVQNQPGRGLRIQLQLPLTLSVLRALLMEVGGEPYAVPLSQIVRTLNLPFNALQTLGDRDHFQHDGQQIGLLTAHQVLECGEPKFRGNEIPIIVLGNRTTPYGLVVDGFLGERELVVQPLDPRLGKVRDISAAALMEDGAPVLIIDVEEMISSIEKLLANGRVHRIEAPRPLPEPRRRRKRVLAVDDSPMVRELQRNLLSGRGYETDVAADGTEAWERVRSGGYDLVITDIDMPRLDGIELTRRIRQDPALRSIPVLVVSYKDYEEDRLRGLDAGADYYLAKGSFEQEKLIRAVVDLIGEAGA